MRLPYWDPIKCIVIDGMHNIFLGLAQFHARSIIGMDIPTGSDTGLEGIEVSESHAEINADAVEAQEKDLVKLRRLLALKPDSKSIGRFKKPTLARVCSERGATLPNNLKSVTKKDLVAALKAR